MKAIPHTPDHHAYAVGSIWSDVGPGTRWVIVDVIRFKVHRRTRHDICFKPYERNVLRPWRTKWMADTTVLSTMEYEGFDEAYLKDEQ
nr:hypothetical protein DBT41_09590 [Aerococcus urinae]